MTANLSLVIHHEALARRGETIYKKGALDVMCFDKVMNWGRRLSPPS